MEDHHGNQAQSQAKQSLPWNHLHLWWNPKREGLFRSYHSQFRLLVIIIAAIFMAEVVAMIVIAIISEYIVRSVPYYQITLIDAGIMTILIFPVLYFLSFRPLIGQVEKSRQAEESLLRSKELQEKFFDSINTLIAYMDRNFDFIQVNHAYAKADGQQPEYFIGKNHFELYPHEENQAIFQRVVESGEAFSASEKPYEYPDHPDQGVTYWDWSLQPVKGSNGIVEGLVLSLVNVTERRRAQDAIRQLSRIVEQTEDTVVVTDCDGVIEYVNPAFERLTGYTKQETFGKTPRVLKSGLHNHHFYQELWNTILKGDVFQSEIANRKKSGELFYEVETIAPLRDIQGNIINFVATGKDITEHKRDEEKLRRAYDELELRVQDRTEELRRTNAELEDEIIERKRAEAALSLARDELELRVQERTEELVKEITERKEIEGQLRIQTTAMEAAANGIVITDRHGNIQWINPALTQISGYETEDLVGHNTKIFNSGQHDKAYYQHMWETILSGEVWRGEMINRRKDASFYIEEQTITPVRSHDNVITQFIAIKQDITERKQVEKDIRERDQKEKILTQTIYTMQLDIARDLHDTIGQNISFLRMKLDHLSEKKIRKQAEMQLELRNMARAANESYDLMRGTLAVLQSENSTDLFRLFTRYAEQIEERASFKINFSSQGEPRFMSARRMRQLFYIFREILNNIEKHANASQVCMEMTWAQDCLSLVVSDNGTGFELDKVQYGRHYGLRFMRERAELLNGSLAFRSAIGSGTTVILQVPYE